MKNPNILIISILLLIQNGRAQTLEKVLGNQEWRVMHTMESKRYNNGGQEHHYMIYTGIFLGNKR